MADHSKMTFETWLRIGLEKKFVGPPVCTTHDDIPTTEDEDLAWDNGDDPCVHMLRLYGDELEALLVEQNHMPSIWRDTYWDEKTLEE
jgi:hypothetical protein